MSLSVSAQIEEVMYQPTLCRSLPRYTMENVESGEALESGAFEIELENGDSYYVSRWVSAKRSRSYPYARVYDTLQGHRRVAIIPLVKDEGVDGDRDYLQWDTVSFMSLLNVYVIPAWYESAEKNSEYSNKITNQEFDSAYIAEKLRELSEYQSDALHWNLKQMDNLEEIADNCLSSYKRISRQTGVRMGNTSMFRQKIEDMAEGRDKFKEESRKRSQRGQQAESKADQPSEAVFDDIGGDITIENFLGGIYYFNPDEVVLLDNKAVLVEKKHSSSTFTPSENSIKDGLLKLVLYTNLNEVIIDGESYEPVACLGLTTSQINSVCTRAQEAENWDCSDTYKERVADTFEECDENGILRFVAPSSLSKDEQIEIIKDAI